MKVLAERMVRWLRREVSSAGKRGVIFGLSGGIDSAVVAALAVRAFGDDCLGLILPCGGRKEDERDAMLVARSLGLSTERYDLKPAFLALTAALRKIDGKTGADTPAFANIKPRLRMTVLYARAAALDLLVAGTGNRSEIMTGYFTKHGDGAADLAPLAMLYKKDVRALARYLGLPSSVRRKPPTAGLWKGQTDEGELGITYAALDSVLSALDSGKSAARRGAAAEKVGTLIRNSAHKRRPAPVFRP